MQKKKEEKKVSDDFSYHITQVKEKDSEFYGMWRVRRSGSSKVIKHFKTQQEAIEHANVMQRIMKQNRYSQARRKIRKQKY